MLSYTITLYGGAGVLQWTFTEETLGHAITKLGRIIEARGIEPGPERTDRMRIEITSYPA